MRKIIPLVLLPLVLLILRAPCVLAQNEDEPEFKMPCKEVLKLGLSKFMDVYGEKTQDYSTYGMKAAYGYYVGCKRPVNDAQARRLGEAKRKQVDDVRDELSKIGNAAWDMTYIAAGGGTMYGLLSVGAYASREDFMTTLITSLARPDRSDTAARRRVQQSIAKTRRMLARMSRPPKLESYGDEPVADKRKQYLDSFKEAQRAANRLQALIRELPDAAAALAAKQMAGELETEVGE